MTVSTSPSESQLQNKVPCRTEATLTTLQIPSRKTRCSPLVPPDKGTQRVMPSRAPSITLQRGRPNKLGFRQHRLSTSFEIDTIDERIIYRLVEDARSTTRWRRRRPRPSPRGSCRP